jgi:phage terminase small subunit
MKRLLINLLNKLLSGKQKENFKRQGETKMSFARIIKDCPEYLKREIHHEWYPKIKKKKVRKK